jgi:hypothetical protein
MAKERKGGFDIPFRPQYYEAKKKEIKMETKDNIKNTKERRNGHGYQRLL